MSAHVSVFDLKRFAEERLVPDELPAFEEHLAGCGECAARLQHAATRELHARGLAALVSEAPVKPTRAVVALFALAASVLVVLSVGQGPRRSASPYASFLPDQHGEAPLAATPADAGMLPGAALALVDGGEQQP